MGTAPHTARDFSSTGGYDDDVDLDARALFGALRRWWWIAVGLPLLTAGIVYLIVSRQTPMYRATATLTVTAPSSGNDPQLDPTRSVALAQTYQELVLTQEVLQPVADRLGGDFTVEVLRGVVTATSPASRFLLRISASDADPEQAATIADAVAQEFDAYIQRRDEEELGTSLAGLDTLIAEQEQSVAAAQRRLDQLRADGASEAAIFQATVDLDDTRQQLRDSQARGQELRAQGALQQAQVQLAARAQRPAAPYAPRTLFYAALGLMVGIAMAGGLIVAVEYLDNTVKPQLNFAELIGAPLMAVVPAAAKRFHHGEEQLFMRTQASSTMAESIRLLRTNIEFAAAAKEIGTLAVTSSEPGEGKSTITANLASGMAQTGFTVVVIDADMRRPNQHRIFGLANAVGLTTLLTRDTTDWRSAAHQVVDGLWVVPSGPIPPNPADLLSGDRFRSTLDTILSSVDVVLVDTPPVLVVSDPLVVATKTDATLLVSRSGSTRIETLRRSAELLHQNGVRLIGVVLNRESGRNARGYSYYYDSDYYTDAEAPTLGPSPVLRTPLTVGADHAR